MKFISLFRHKTIITNGEDYYTSLLMQAIEFIEKLNPSNLKQVKDINEKFELYEKKELLENLNVTNTTGGKIIIKLMYRKQYSEFDQSS